MKTFPYEVDPRQYEQLGQAMDNRESRDNRVFNGSTKMITFFLATMNVLCAAAVIGLVVMYGKVEALDSKVDLIISGHIKIQAGP